MSDISGESNMEKYRNWCKENMAKKVLEKIPNTFSILYRSGSIKKTLGPPIIEHDGEVIIESPDTHFTGKFTEDISDYFKNRLIEGGVNVTDDIAIRTSPLSWSIYFEVYCGLVQIDGSSISTNDLFKNNRTDFVKPCEMNIIENIPMCLFDKFNIINYPEWGEVVMFNHDKLKSDILDKCAMSGSTENMEKSYQEILEIIEKFSNTYNVLSERLLDVVAKKPFEITREENRILNLRNTVEFKRLLEEKRAIELQEQTCDGEGIFIIENGRHDVKGPNYDSWKTRHDEWVTSYKSWFSNIEYDYKLCFKACYEKMMKLDGEYMSRDFQFPGFIIYTNTSGNTIFN
jgi:hypothetical protein